MRKVQASGKREAECGVLFLNHLFKTAVVSNAKVASSMNFTRSGAAKLIERFVGLQILHDLDETATYGKTYYYKKYINMFND